MISSGGQSQCPLRISMSTNVSTYGNHDGLFILTGISSNLNSKHGIVFFGHFNDALFYELVQTGSVYPFSCMNMPNECKLCLPLPADLSHSSLTNGGHHELVNEQGSSLNCQNDTGNSHCYYSSIFILENITISNISDLHYDGTTSGTSGNTTTNDENAIHYSEWFEEIN